MFAEHLLGCHWLRSQGRSSEGWRGFSQVRGVPGCTRCGPWCWPLGLLLQSVVVSVHLPKLDPGETLGQTPVLSLLLPQGVGLKVT